MSAPVKRKRGRPRLDEPREIRDFDINLILEFKKFPVFYDRQHPHHRNREYTDRIWQSIAQNLNVSMNLVKTRMLQLRNRFNLEKRRVEAMDEQQQGSATSQWSLYESLAFLSDYVKTRRPYSLQVSRNTKTNSSDSSSDADDDDEDEAPKRQEHAYNANHVLSNGNTSTSKKVDGLSANQNHLVDQNSAVPQYVQRTILQPVEANKEFGSKYNAFGKFLASSLVEMNEIQALNLVEKFTIDVVKCLKAEERKKHFINASQINNTDGDDENSVNVY